MRHTIMAGELQSRPTEAGVALDALLSDAVGALVAAVGSDARLVTMPDSVPLHGRDVYAGELGLDMMVDGDQFTVINGWERAQEEPVVTLELHLLADPDEPVTLHLFDVRVEHGVHVLVLETPDPALVFDSSVARAALRRPVAHVKRDAVSVFLEVDEATTRLLGWPATDLVGRRTIDFIHPEDVEGSVDNWMAMRAGTGPERRRARFRHADGHYVWLEVINHNHLDDPEHGCVLSEMVDISEEMSELEALHDRERLLARLAQALPIGICHLRPDGEVVYLNEPMVDLLGNVDSPDALVRSVAESDRLSLEAALNDALRGNASVLEVGVFRGLEERRCELTLRTMEGDRGGVDGIILCAADVTDRSRLRVELEHRASHDALSGCLNQTAIVAELGRALREAQQVAVAYIDLNQLKAVNDELGHAAGDELLRVAAARLRGAIRATDRLGRLGGDEFVVICPRSDELVEPGELVDRFSEALRGDVVIDEHRVPLRASLGVVVSIAGEHAESVLHRADVAMYAEKRRARNRGQNFAISTLYTSY